MANRKRNAQVRGERKRAQRKQEGSKRAARRRDRSRRASQGRRELRSEIEALHARGTKLTTGNRWMRGDRRFRRDPREQFVEDAGECLARWFEYESDVTKRLVDGDREAVKRIGGLIPALNRTTREIEAMVFLCRTGRVFDDVASLKSFLQTFSDRPEEPEAAAAAYSTLAGEREDRNGLVTEGLDLRRLHLELDEEGLRSEIREELKLQQEEQRSSGALGFDRLEEFASSAVDSARVDDLPPGVLPEPVLPVLTRSERETRRKSESAAKQITALLMALWQGRVLASDASSLMRSVQQGERSETLRAWLRRTTKRAAERASITKHGVDLLLADFYGETAVEDRYLAAAQVRWRTKEAVRWYCRDRIAGVGASIIPGSSESRQPG